MNNSYKRLLFFVRPYLKRTAFSVVCMIIAASAYLVVPWLIQNVVDKVLMQKELRMLNAIAFAILGSPIIWPG